MRIFINFWKLETENNFLHVFNFLYKLSFENSFCFLSILGCQTSFLVSKIENCFWKQKIRGKNSYQTYQSFKCFSTLYNIVNVQLVCKTPWTFRPLNYKLKTVFCMFLVSFTNWVLITVFVFCLFWVAKQVF